jgi:PAS domain S-box-containing protein
MTRLGAISVLIVEDNESDAQLDVLALEDAGYEVEWRRVQEATELGAALEENGWDLVLSDHRMPRFDAFDALAVLRASRVDIPLIVVSGAVGEETAVAVMLEGAADFVSKDRLGRLGAVVAVHLREAENRRRRRIAEDALVESQERFKQAFENAPIGIALMALDGRWTRVNRALSAITGYTADQLLTKRSGEISHPDDVEAEVEPRARLVAGEIGDYKVEKRYLGAQGEIVWVSLSVSLVRDPRGEPSYYIYQVEDISERKWADEELRAARDAALEASRLKSDFVANVSHEIRTPLSGVVGLSELLLGTELDTDQRQLVAGVCASADALMSVINDILDFSKIEAGKLELDIDDFSPRKLVKDVCAIVAGAAEEGGINLDVAVDAIVPRTVRSDGNRWRQVLANLVKNAVKHGVQAPRRVAARSGRLLVRHHGQSLIDGAAEPRL